MCECKKARGWRSTPLGKQLLRQKTFDAIEKNVNESKLARTLTVPSLISLGIGMVVGAGIFVLTGQVASRYAGPALVLSFVVSGIACFFAGLCYAELSASIPITGSSYSYTYVACGEGFAWIVGLCLTFENLFASAAVAVAWSAGVQVLLQEVGVAFPVSYGTAPLKVTMSNQIVSSGASFNALAVAIVVLLTFFLCVGLRESMTFNNIAVIIKLLVLGVFILYGVYYACSHTSEFRDNISPFIPPNEGEFGKYGVSGIFRGAGSIFFAYVGFDNVCCLAQETKNPSRDVPRGIFGTLGIATVLYILVTFFLTGMMNYRLLDVDAPVIVALGHVNAHPAFRIIAEVGMIAGVTSVCLAALLGMARLLLMLSSDGLLPKALSYVHDKRATPLYATITAGAMSCFLAGAFPLDLLGEMVSFGTLVAYTMVCISAVRMRRQYPDVRRPFVAPVLPLVASIGVIFCAIQLFSLPFATWRNCLIALSLGTAYYFLRGRYTSNFEIRLDDTVELHSIEVPHTILQLEAPRNPELLKDLPRLDN